jgi:hypothetical protein
MELNFTQLTFETPQTRRLTLATEQVLKDSYLEESQEIAHWIINQRLPARLLKGEVTKFKQNALQYIVQERHLF